MEFCTLARLSRHLGIFAAFFTSSIGPNSVMCRSVMLSFGCERNPEVVVRRNCWGIYLTNALLLEGWSPSRTTARLQPKNHFRFHLTQLLLLYYNFLSTTCNLLRFQQSTPPVPDEFSILKLLQLTLLALADRQASGLID